MALLDDLLTVHTVTVLESTGDTTVTGADKNSYQAVRSLQCRVIPMSTFEMVKLGQNGLQATHKVRFASDPGVLDERHRLRWEGIGNRTIFRIPKFPYNPHGLSMMWTLYADMTTLDNELQDQRVE